MNTSTQYVALLFAMSVILPMDGVSAQQPAEPRFSASTTAVVVDVVVRDKQKHPVAGLTADDFTVFEDGKRQEMTSFVAVGASSRVAHLFRHQARPGRPRSALMILRRSLPWYSSNSVRRAVTCR